MIRSLIPFGGDRSRSLSRPVESADPFFRLHTEMNRLFDEAFAGFAPAAYGAGFGHSYAAGPRIDVRETDKTLEIEAELPGVDEENVDVELADNILTIRGEKKGRREEKENGGYRLSERSYGAFSRSIALPYDVDADKADAVFRNGVLKLTLQKPAEVQAKTRKISLRKG